MSIWGPSRVHFGSIRWSIGVDRDLGSIWCRRQSQGRPPAMHAPGRPEERLFAIAVLVFGFTMFSSFLGSITGLLTHIRNTAVKRSEEAPLMPAGCAHANCLFASMLGTAQCWDPAGGEFGTTSALPAIWRCRFKFGGLLLRARPVTLKRRHMSTKCQLRVDYSPLGANTSQVETRGPASPMLSG